MKNWFFILVLLALPVQADQTCDELYGWIQANKVNIDNLSKEVQLQMLDIQSYNPDQHDTPEYIERKATFDSYVLNFNAIVQNHNQTINFYQQRCE